MYTVVLTLTLAMCFANIAAQGTAQGKEGFEFKTKDGLYKVVNEAKNWNDALEDCKANGMSLVSLQDQAKMIRIHFPLFKHNYLRSASLQPDAKFFYWIGGNNLKDPNSFVWAGTGKRITYFHWQHVNEEQPGNCIVSGLHAFSRWSNATCESEYFYICEKRKK
ncbi:snaclec coagulation factor IX/factor X-binding protein subunit A-like isoform X2 [Eurosta solidaginis]|uniref:snaclec coagulation factor IX/factor X-binding protein subunit A-like isoform X2 n=1 Tax=Eurosta solidaginis TaxID=178769 RepID=UPI003530B074